MDLEQQLRETYAERLAQLDMTGGDVDATRRTGARLRVRRRVSVAAAAVAVVAVAVGGSLLGAGRVAVGPSHDNGTWRELPAAPLTPRANAEAVWTGREVVVLGGETQPCPPNADCAVSGGHALRDGAAYDPATNTWHRIARAPVPVGPGDRLLSAAGRVVLRDWQRHGSRLFVYDPQMDQWFEIRSFSGSMGDLPSAVDGRVYGFVGDHIAMYDASRGLWTELPPDPLRPKLTQRRITATSSGPVVTGVPADVPRDGSVAPVVTADVYDGSSWHRLPATGQVGNNAWFWTGTQMVDPEPGSLDGGQVDGWGRAYPVGGILDPATGRWSPLPAAFTDHGGGADINASGGRWVATYGQVYDTATGRVDTLPHPDGAPSYGVTAAWADGRLLAFGGATFGAEGTALSDRSWLWTP